jgi:hypothetical protein
MTAGDTVHQRYKRLYDSVNRMMHVLGRDGTISRRGALADAVIDALIEIDRGEPMAASMERQRALLWLLWTHQRSSSAVGQAVRCALGMGQHESMTDEQTREAARYIPPYSWEN